MNSKEAKMRAKEILSEGKSKLILATFLSLIIPQLPILFLGLLEFSKSFPMILIILSLIILIWQRGVLFSITKMYIAKKNGEEIETFGFLKDSFKEMKRAWMVTFSLIPKFIIPIFCYIGIIVLTGINIYISATRMFCLDEVAKGLMEVSSIISILIIVLYVVTMIITIRISYKYRYADIEAIMNPELTARKVVEKTGKIMEGNRMNSFKLDLSFVLWIFLLACVACFISRLSELFGIFATSFVTSIIQVSIMMAHIVFYENLDTPAFDEVKSFDVIPDYMRDRDEQSNPFNY